MKKIIFLNLIIATVSMSNVTSGFIEGIYDGKYEDSYNIKETGLSTEINLKNEGVSLGATLKMKDVSVPIKEHTLVDSIFDNSNIFIKYKTPKFKGIGGYFKGTLKPKIKRENEYLSFKTSVAELEGEANYEFLPDSKIAFNSKTEFPFTGNDILTTNKLYLEGKDIKNLKNIKASIELKNSYHKTSALRYLSINSEGEYDATPKFKLNGKTDFRYQFNNTSKVKNILTDEDFELNPKDYEHSYTLDTSYLTLNDRLELTGGIFFQHIYFNSVSITSDEISKIYKYKDKNTDISTVLFDSLKNIQFNEEEKDFLNKHKEEYENYKKVAKIAREKYEEGQKDLGKSREKAFKNIIEMEKIILENEKVKKIVYENLNKIKNGANENKTLEEVLNEIKNKFYPSMTVLDLEDYQERPAKTYEIITNFINDNLGLNDMEARNIYPKIAPFIGSIKEYKAKKDNLKIKISSDYKIYSLLTTLCNKWREEPNGYIKKQTLIGKLWNQIFNDSGSSKLLIDNLVNKTISNFATLGFGVPAHDFNYGVKLGAKYKIMDELTFSANGMFAGNTRLSFKKYTKGYVKLESGIKYDYTEDEDNITVSPEFNAIAKLYNIEKSCDAELILSPKLSAVSTPIDNLKINGEIEIPIKFDNKGGKKFNYSNTAIKTKFNIKYVW